MTRECYIGGMNEREYRRYRRVLILKRQRRKKALMITMAIMLSILLILFFSLAYQSIQSKANSGYKYYTSILVNPGDSVWTIAEKYMDSDHYCSVKHYVDEVSHINHLNDDNKIIAGQSIVIPYFSLEMGY